MLRVRCGALAQRAKWLADMASVALVKGALAKGHQEQWMRVRAALLSARGTETEHMATAQGTQDRAHGNSTRLDARLWQTCK